MVVIVVVRVFSFNDTFAAAVVTSLSITAAVFMICVSFARVRHQDDGKSYEESMPAMNAQYLDIAYDTTSYCVTEVISNIITGCSGFVLGTLQAQGATALALTLRTTRRTEI